MNRQCETCRYNIIYPTRIIDCSRYDASDENRNDEGGCPYYEKEESEGQTSYASNTS